IILFSKGCPNPSCVVVVAVAPAQAVTSLAHWQPPCQGVATPAAGAIALQPAPFASAMLQATAAPAGWPQALPLAGVVGLPFRLALVAANRPLPGGRGRNLAVGGRPAWGLAVAGRPSSLLPSL
ncbi:hypothetical protein BHE74_00027500, partial [Ensete ventricosum]